MREEVLQFMQKKEWDNAFKILKDDDNFKQLIEDQSFKHVFEKFFIKELIDFVKDKSETHLLNKIFIFHKQPCYDFRLQDDDFKSLVIHLAKKTREHLYAKEFPENPICKAVIEECIQRTEKELKKQQYNKRLNASFRLTNDNRSNLFASCIFQSFNELYCYKALLGVYSDCLILPKVSIATIIDSNILGSLEEKYKSVYLSSFVDYAIINIETFKVELVVELKDEFYNSNDLKYNILTTADISICKIEKLRGEESIHAYIDKLNEFRITNASK